MKRSAAAKAAHGALTSAAKSPAHALDVSFAKDLTIEDGLSLRQSASHAFSIACGRRKPEEANDRLNACIGEIALANPQVVLRIEPLWISTIPPEAITPEMAKIAVNHDGGALELLPVPLRTPALCAVALIMGHANSDYRNRPIEESIPADVRARAMEIHQAAVQFALNAP